MNFEYVVGAPYFDWLSRGLAMTVWIAAVSGALAFVIGFAILRCRTSARWPLRVFGTAFVLLFRNVPLVPLFLFLTAGVPGLWQLWFHRQFPRGFELDLVLVGLACNTGAYVSEILRAGVEAVATEQVEAARVLGLPPSVIRRRIVYPQAIRVVAPALASRFIHNMKNSAMSVVVPLPVDSLEIVGQASRIAGQTFAWAEPLMAAALAHLFLAVGIGRLIMYWAVSVQARVASAS